MKKFIIAVIAIAVVAAVANRASVELHERSIRAVEREIAVQRLAEGMAPMQQECEQAEGVVFRVDAETGVTRCMGVAGGFKMKLSTMMQNEVFAMAVMNEACARDGGIMTVEKSLYNDNTTIMACSETKFQSYWAGK